MRLAGGASQTRRLYGLFTHGLAFPALVFFAVFLYLWLYLDPALLYCYFMPSREFPCFSTGMEFFKSFLPYQGGPAAYAAAFLSQLYHWSWLGAVVITSVAGLLCLATAGVFNCLGGTRLRALHYVPAVLMLMLYGQFSHPLAAALALLTALLLANLYMRLAPRNGWLAAAAFVALFAAAYYLTAGACLVFAGLCATFELLSRRRVLPGAAFVALAPILAFLAERYVFRITTIQASMRLLPLPLPGVLAGLYLYCLAAGVLIALRNRFFSGRAPGPEKPAGCSSVQAATAGLWPRMQRSLESPFLVLLAVIPLYCSLDARTRTVSKFDYYSQHGMWQQILREAERVPVAQYSLPGFKPLICDINRSLYQTNQLSENMFRYLQDPDGLVPIVSRSETCLALTKATDLWLDLGYLEESEHGAHELLQLNIGRPATLQRLALINIVKGETGAARVFLGVLGKDLVYGEAGRRDLERLQSDPGFAADPEVQRLRSLRITEDSVEPHSLENMFLSLLKANRRNRMAFEYLMAYYLLACRPDKVAQNISRLDDFEYRGIPRHYEEAILMQTAITGKTVDLHGRTIRPETMQRFEDFRRIIARHGADATSAMIEAAEDHRDTYFWYCLLRMSRVKGAPKE
jgi:hypothetical protein